MSMIGPSPASRRMFLAGGAAVAATALTSVNAAASSVSYAADVAAVSGDSPVFLDYSQAQLDAAYDQSQWAANSKEIISSYGRQSEEVRKSYSYQSYKYGPSAAETLDVYPASKTDAPVVVFIHGGAWRGLSKAESSFAAPTFVDRGMHFVALDFALIPAVTLPEMATQIQRAIGWLYHNAKQFGGDRKQIHLLGHSSGAHLAATMLTSDWRRFGAPPQVIRTATCVSGMYDLYPVLLSSRGSYVHVSPKERDALSPILHVGEIDSPVLIAYGTKESPEFIRQSRSFGAALRDKPVKFVVAKDVNHFEIASELAISSSPLSQSVISHMGNARS